MKTISSFLFIFALLCINRLSAQDIITKTDSTKIVATITEINPTQVRYKLFSYPDGPFIIANKSEIAYIVFKNGIIQRFPKVLVPAPAYDANRYNLDKVPVMPYNADLRAKKCETLYKYKNYIGFNYIAFLNTALGFNYMRDIKKANLVINVPVAVGLGTPSITNGLYGRQYLDNTGSTKYQRMKYQTGLNVLFAPNMTREVNFLLGPSFNYTAYDMNVNTVWNVPSAVPYQSTQLNFKNTFELRRRHYGVNVGFMARFSDRFNMNMLLSLGFKSDSYSEKDPYGVEVIKTSYTTTRDNTMPDNVMPYVNFAWSLGYRF